MQVSQLNYQRNGTVLNGFYSCLFNYEGEILLCTWIEEKPECDENFRAVNISDPMECYRGDYISFELGKVLRELKRANGINYIFDLKNVINAGLKVA